MRRMQFRPDAGRTICGTCGTAASAANRGGVTGAERVQVRDDGAGHRLGAHPGPGASRSGRCVLRSRQYHAVAVQAGACEVVPQDQFFGHAAAEPDGPLSNSTRYLCAAAYLNPEYANSVTSELLASHRAVAPSLGIDLIPIVRHCLSARKAQLLRDVLLTVLLIAACSWRPRRPSRSWSSRSASASCRESSGSAGRSASRSWPVSAPPW